MTNPNDSAGFSFEPNESGYGDALTIELANGQRFFIPFSKGLTKREHIATMAMQGMLANTFKLGQMGNDMTAVNPEKISQQALMFTDALIKELNKKQ